MVSYKLFSGKRLVKDHEQTTCFVYITQFSFSKEIDKVVIYPHLYQMQNFTEEEIKIWIKTINLWGFKCHYDGKDNLRYYFSIDLKKMYNKPHLTSTLILIRYLWEQEEILKKYFSLREDRRNKFKAMLEAHNINVPYINSNHTLRDYRKQTLTSHKEILKRIKECEIPVHGESSRYDNLISNLWRN